MAIRIASLLLLSVTSSFGAYVYECGPAYDCVTPFQRVRAPLPSGASIPLPSGINPAFIELPFNPTITNALGHTVGTVGFSSSLPLAFFFDGTATTLANLDLGALPVDISDDDRILLNVGSLPTLTMPPNVTQPFGISLPGTDVSIGFNPPFVYHPFLALAISADGTLVLARSEKRDLETNSIVLANDLLVLWSERPLAPISEARPIWLVGLGLALFVARPLIYRRIDRASRCTHPEAGRMEAAALRAKA